MSAPASTRKLGFKNGTALLIGGVLGGGIGFAAYGFTPLAIATFWIGAPLLAMSACVKAIELALPKGDLKDKIKTVTVKLFNAGLVAAFFPMVALGVAGFMGTKKLLDTVHKPFQRKKADVVETTAPAAAEASDSGLKNRRLGPAFAAVRTRAAAVFKKAAPTPKPEAPQPPQP